MRRRREGMTSSMPDKPRAGERTTVQVDLSAAQARWLREAGRQTGQSQSELLHQAIQLLRKATSYKREIEPDDGAGPG
ncbi:MAG: hypothetical protein M3P44_10930 [Actinomycetota bacterium]|nr:hypothetical protein [Actinomycetota bacterium]